MLDREKVNSYLQNLPSLKPDEPFRFQCHPQIACFNLCCSDLDLILHPYDVLRLRRALQITSREFLLDYTEVETTPGNGFPQVSLRMREDEKKTCPFISPTGCLVYKDRPGACRSYPLGRGASLNPDGSVQVQYVLIQEDHCQGFLEEPEWTVESWIKDQDLAQYFTFNDKHLLLVSQWNQKRRAVQREQFRLILLGLYCGDEFGEYIRKRGLLESFQVPALTKEAIYEDESQRLLYAMEWIEKVLLTDSCSYKQGCK